MAKYKVGDKVKFKKDLVVGEVYNGITFLSGMEDCIDSVGEIIDEADSNAPYVKFNSPCRHYYLGIDMIEKVEEEKKVP